METIVDVRSQVHECLRYLADHCDGARENDHEGFNKLDARFGRQLADAPQLSLAQMVVGAKMLRKYRRQLAGGDLHVPTNQEIEAYLAEQRRTFRERVLGPVQASSLSLESSESKYHVSVEQERIFVEYPYDRAIYEAIRPLKQTVTDWAFDRYGRKEWSYPLEAVNLVIDALQPFEHKFFFTSEIAAVIEQERQDAEQARQEEELEQAFAELERVVALEAVKPYLAGEPVANGQILYAHQREAVRLLIERKRMILAHDLGLGKTRTALIAAKGYGLPIFVICPASVQINWLREAEMVQVPIEVYSWAKLPEPPEDQDYIIIADEAHYAQNIASRRTKGFLSLAEHARAVYALTGTPMKNAQPINLYPLLVACKHPLTESLRAYERRYCNGHYKSIGRKHEVFDVTGSSNLDELHRKVKDVILYKRKDECLKDLPPKIRLMRLAEVSKEEERAYHAMIDRLWKEHDTRMEQKREERLAILRQDLSSNLDDDLVLERMDLGDDVDEVVLLDELAEDAENARALVELGILRHAGSQAKIGTAIAIAQEIVEQGESIVLFCAYRDTAARLAEALDADCLSGDTDIQERQRMIDRFQAKQTHILICMIGAGGVGITLTAAQTVVLVDRPWTPGDAVQCEDRLHRIGQVGSVTAIWLQYGPIDEKIDLLLQQKQERIDLVLRGKRKSMRGVSRSIRSMAKEILDSIRSGSSIEALFDQVDDADPPVGEKLKHQHPVSLVSQPMRVVDSTLAETTLPAKTSVPATDVPAQPTAPSLGESKVVKVYGDNAMHQYIQAQAARGQSVPLAAYERVVEQRLVTFTCAQCHTTVTQWRYPSRGPSYCRDECRDEVHKKQTRERVRRYRERKAAQQGENPS
jgi:SNF2 family DNA or RNA helicase